MGVACQTRCGPVHSFYTYTFYRGLRAMRTVEGHRVWDYSHQNFRINCIIAHVPMALREWTGIAPRRLDYTVYRYAHAGVES